MWGGLGFQVLAPSRRAQCLLIGVKWEHQILISLLMESGDLQGFSSAALCYLLEPSWMLCVEKVKWAVAGRCLACVVSQQPLPSKTAAQQQAQVAGVIIVTMHGDLPTLSFFLVEKAMCE